MTTPLQKMTDRERRLLLDVGLRHNYAAVGDRWVEVKLADAKKLGLRGGADCLWAVLSDHLSERFQLAFVHCAERLTEDLLSQGKAQLHLRR